MSRRLYARYRYARTETHISDGVSAWELDSLREGVETPEETVRRVLDWYGAKLFTRADVRKAKRSLRPYGKPRVIVVSVYRRRGFM